MTVCVNDSCCEYEVSTPLQSLNKFNKKKKVLDIII